MNLGAISTLVFDLDGVVWRGDAPIESAITAINELRAAGKRCLYCTNNSSKTQASFVAKLSGMGIEGVAEEDVITSSVATATYLSAQFTGPFLAYVVGGEGIRLALQKIGARIVPDSDITEETNVDCVIAGIDREFNYEKLTTAQRLIRRGALFVATNRDSTYPIEDGVIPGSGAIVSAIETAAGSTPVTVGKPRPVMLQLVMQKYNLQPAEMAFIGDRLDTDIVCARRAGVPALLVTTGVTTLAEARRAKGEMRPDAVFPDLTSFSGVMLGRLSETPTEAATAVAASTVAATVASEEVIPESAPMVEEASAEVTEIVDESLAAETVTDETVAEEAAIAEPFALEAGDAGISAESAAETPAELLAVEPLAFDTASLEAAEAESTLPIGDEASLEISTSSSEEVTAEGWDESWFTESESTSEGEASVSENFANAGEPAETTTAEADFSGLEIQDEPATQSAATGNTAAESPETESPEATKPEVEEDKTKEDAPATTNSFDWKLD